MLINIQNIGVVFPTTLDDLNSLENGDSLENGEIVNNIDKLINISIRIKDQS